MEAIHFCEDFECDAAVEKNVQWSGGPVTHSPAAPCAVQLGAVVEYAQIVIVRTPSSFPYVHDFEIVIIYHEYKYDLLLLTYCQFLMNTAVMPRKILLEKDGASSIRSIYTSALQSVRTTAQRTSFR